MENYLIALIGYGLLFVASHFIRRKKSSKQVQLSADYVLSDHKENIQNNSERMENKSVA
jgi:hypothetical protein